MQKLSPYYGNRQPKFSRPAVDILEKYSWPGNVRELENVVESILALTQVDEIMENELPSRLRSLSSAPNGVGESSVGNELALHFEEAERAYETEIILKALKSSNFVQTKAAEILGISRRILKYKMSLS